MTVGLMVDCFFYELGSGDFVHSFFSTISYHLEPKGWGTEYPYLLKNLYNDKLSWHDVDKARGEVQDIESKLENLKWWYGILKMFHKNHHGEIILVLKLQVLQITLLQVMEKPSLKYCITSL